jgi:predicted DNA-binding protein (UPF0251 family)
VALRRLLGPPCGQEGHAMNQLPLDQFLAMGWSLNVQAKLRDMATKGDIDCLVAWDNAGKMSASAYTAEPPVLDTAIAIWRRRPLPPAQTETVKSKTQLAVELVRREGLNPNTAARQMGVHASAVYRALQRADTKKICPCCGQVVREGFEVKTPSGGPACA